MIIFKRKQAVLVLVVCMILVAGYINWAYQTKDGTNAEQIAAIEQQNQDRQRAKAGEDVENLGQATLVNAPVTEAGKDAIALAKQSRDEARAKSIEMFRETAENESLDKESRADAQSQLTKIAANAEKEGVCEGLIETKVARAAVFISDGGASISVDSDNLTESDVAKIKDIIVTHGSIAADKIKVSSTK